MIFYFNLIKLRRCLGIKPLVRLFFTLFVQIPKDTMIRSNKYSGRYSIYTKCYLVTSRVTLLFSGIPKYLKYIDKSKNKKRYLTSSLINFFSKRLTKHYLPLKQSYQPRELLGISTLVHIEKHKVQWAKVDLFMFNEGHYIRKEDSPCPGGLPWPIFESCRDEVHGGGDYSWPGLLAILSRSDLCGATA